MPIPAVLGIGAILTFLGDLILKVWLKYSKYIVRTAGVTLMFAGYAAIFLTMYNLLMGFADAAMQTASTMPNVSNGLSIMGSFVPENWSNAISMIISMEIIGMTFKWLTWGVSKKTYIFRA